MRPSPKARFAMESLAIDSDDEDFMDDEDFDFELYLEE
jgi:hypothetical protein